MGEYWSPPNQPFPFLHTNNSVRSRRATSIGKTSNAVTTRLNGAAPGFC